MLLFDDNIRIVIIIMSAEGKRSHHQSQTVPRFVNTSNSAIIGHTVFHVSPSDDTILFAYDLQNLKYEGADFSHVKLFLDRIIILNLFLVKETRYFPRQD